MNLFLTQLRRGKLFTALLALTLTAAVAFLSISFSAWQSIMAQMTGISQQYTTIAIPSVADQYSAYDLLVREPQRLSGLVEPESYSAAALSAPQLLSVDRRCLLSAYVEGQRALSSGALDPLQYVFEYDLYNYNLSVLAVRCTSVIDSSNKPYTMTKEEAIRKYHYSEEMAERLPDVLSFSGSKLYSATFEFVDAVSRLESYDLPYADADVSWGNPVCNEDGSFPFEEGKTYLIRGFYFDFPIWARSGSYEDGSGWASEKYRADPSQERGVPEHMFYSHRTNTSYDIVGQGNYVTGSGGTPNFIVKYGDFPGEENTTYSYYPEDSLPFVAEYTGDWRDFLDTPEGKVWRDVIIPMCELNQHSAAVILTDSLQSMYAFNTGSASVMEGREFTPEEYVGGAPVCLVSASYAILNDLQVGDTLNLDFYNPGYAVERCSESTLLGSREGTTVSRLPMQEADRIGVKQDYTIVGIYSAPEFTLGVHNFTADTIFVPKASMPDAQRYEDPYSDYLNTYVLENGKASEFEAYMAENGYGRSFLYFDQDFGSIISALESLRSNAQRLLIVGLAAFLLAAALFVFLSLRRMAPAARGMRLIGMKPGGVWREMSAALGALGIGSAVLGGILGAALYGVVARSVLSAPEVLHPLSLAACAALSGVVLLAMGAVCALPLAGCGLMQKPKTGK